MLAMVWLYLKYVELAPRAIYTYTSYHDDVVYTCVEHLRQKAYTIDYDDAVVYTCVEEE